MILIPMAGLSSRFFNAGFTEPKYMLEVHGRSLFEHAVSSFKYYFNSEHFVFVVRNVYSTCDFVDSKAIELGIRSYEIVALDEVTRGQAETVYIALEKIDFCDGSLTVFNIDTFRPGFRFPEKDTGDGYLEVFKGDGEHWSFVEPAPGVEGLVKRTAEKERISDLCSTGLYHFSSAQDFIRSYLDFLKKPQSEWTKGELYIAPLYNLMIESGRYVHYHVIDRGEVIFCGTPDEYYSLMENKI